MISKNILSVFILSLSIHLLSAQNEKDFSPDELKSRLQKSIAMAELYGNLDDEQQEQLIEQYKCLNKHYKLKFNEQSEFLTKEEFIKKYKDASNQTVERNSFMYHLMMRNYDYRLAVQKERKKCITRKEVDW